MVPTRKQIMERMENLAKEQDLRFAIPATFGGGVAIIELNKEKAKKYALKVGKDASTAEESKPYWTNDNTKPIAKWVNDRLGDLME